MAIVRVVLEKVELLKFPAHCPCCGAVPASSPTPLVKGGAVVYTAAWPHCGTCDANERSRQRSLFWTQGLAVLGLVTLGIVAPVLTWGVPAPRGAPLLAWMVGAGLPAVAVVLHRGVLQRLPLPRHAVRKGAGVDIHRGGAHLIAKGFVIDVSFFRPEYAAEFVALNRAHVTQVKGLEDPKPSAPPPG